MQLTFSAQYSATQGRSDGYIAASSPGPIEAIHRPKGLSPAQAFEPIAIGRNASRDWLRARQMELGELLSPFKKNYIEKMFKQHAVTNAQRGIAGLPLADEPGAARYAIVGDFGDGSENERRVLSQIKASNPRALLTVGDNVYPTGRERDWVRGWDKSGYATFAATTPVHPALGNHDHYNRDLSPYFKRFSHLDGKAYYSWKDGAAEFFALDTEQFLNGSSAQGKWLDSALGSSTAPWKIVYMHRPPYSSAGVESGVQTGLRESLGPVLAKHGVKLVISGHEHSYERSHAQDGVTFITTGGGGATLRPFRVAQPEWSAFRNAVHGFVTLDISDSSVIVRARDDAGKVFDTVRIPRSATAQARAGVASAATSPAQ